MWGGGKKRKKSRRTNREDVGQGTVRQLTVWMKAKKSVVATAVQFDLESLSSGLDFHR